MNGREIEKLLSLIDESVDASRRSLRAEIFRYIQDSEQVVLDGLRNQGQFSIPTSSGPYMLRLADLEALVA